MALKPTAPLPHTWEEHLNNLAMDKKWVFTHLNLLDQGKPLATAIWLGQQAREVSHGSFKDSFGMAAWVYYHDKTNETLGSGQLVTLGYPEDQCSYQSEVSGLYGIAAIIAKMGSFHDLSGGSITVMCDGESALHRCFKPWASNPLAKHFNIIQATRTTIAKTQLCWSWEHFWQHQDGMGQQLTTMEQHNVDMDKAAKEHWQQQQHQQQRTLICFVGESWCIFVGQKKMSTNLKY